MSRRSRLLRAPPAAWSRLGRPEGRPRPLKSIELVPRTLDHRVELAAKVFGHQLILADFLTSMTHPEADEPLRQDPTQGARMWVQIRRRQIRFRAWRCGASQRHRMPLIVRTVSTLTLRGSMPPSAPSFHTSRRVIGPPLCSDPSSQRTCPRLTQSGRTRQRIESLASHSADGDSRQTRAARHPDATRSAQCALVRRVPRRGRFRRAPRRAPKLEQTRSDCR